MRGNQTFDMLQQFSQYFWTYSGFKIEDNEDTLEKPDLRNQKGIF